MDGKYKTEVTKGRDGKDVWVARDPHTEGPYGVGATKRAAIEDLEAGIDLWSSQAQASQSKTDSWTVGQVEGVWAVPA